MIIAVHVTMPITDNRTASTTVYINALVTMGITVRVSVRVSRTVSGNILPVTTQVLVRHNPCPLDSNGAV